MDFLFLYQNTKYLLSSQLQLDHLNHLHQNGLAKMAKSSCYFCSTPSSQCQVGIHTLHLITEMTKSFLSTI